MRKIILVLSITVFVIGISRAQEVKSNLRFIEVTGSAETSVEPDEIRFQIGIQEYWKEEYERGKKYKDYITKIPLIEIEKNLMRSLVSVGIAKDQIVIKEIGQNWNRSGKDFKKSKTFELVLTDLKKVNDILAKVQIKGINSMRIAALKNKDIIKYRKQIKIEAMKAAKKKAGYLLESVNEELGSVISVIELDESIPIWRPENILSNTIISSNDSDINQSMRKIKLKYEIKVRFEIK